MTAFTTGGDSRSRYFYLVFEWADGGNLENVYERNPTPRLNKELLKLTVAQLLGICEALEMVHGKGVRHGDLKPANILCFTPTNGNIFGTLKISDWGLSKFHSEATVWRAQRGLGTSTNYGTPLYEPPEVALGEVKLLGRQYDIWSLGCVFLEILIWLLNGYQKVQAFRSDIRRNSLGRVAYYEIQEKDGQLDANLCPVVVKWMDRMANEPPCRENTTLGAILNLVKTHLLVIKLPPGMGQTMELSGSIEQRKTPLPSPIWGWKPCSRSMNGYDSYRSTLKLMSFNWPINGYDSHSVCDKVHIPGYVHTSSGKTQRGYFT